MKTTAIITTTLNIIDRSGTPCLFWCWKKRGNCPSTDIWCRARAVPVIAFSAERTSATISIAAISQSIVLPPLPKTLSAKLTKIVFGSAELPFAPSTRMNEIGISV